MINSDIYFDREIKKQFLDTYVRNRINYLDSSIDKLIKEIEDEIQKSSTYIAEIDKLLNQPDELSYEYAGLASEKTNILLSMIDIENEMYALNEIKIIYSFKQLEISLKKLLSVSYEKNTIPASYKWQSLIEFFKTRNIDMREVKKYKEINQLRIANNFLKHSGIYVDQSISVIPEFKNRKTLSYKDLENFYNRVKPCVIIFINSIANYIYNDLFEFDEKRLLKIATSLALRLNKEDAKILSKSLLKHYE